MNSNEETHIRCFARRVAFVTPIRNADAIGIIMFFHGAHEMLINARRRARSEKQPAHNEKYQRQYERNGGRTFHRIDLRLIRE